MEWQGPRAEPIPYLIKVKPGDPLVDPAVDAVDCGRPRPRKISHAVTNDIYDRATEGVRHGWLSRVEQLGCGPWGP